MNYQLAGMGRKSEIVHVDRLKPYFKPSNSVLRNAKNNENVEIHEQSPNKSKEETSDSKIEITELVEKIEEFIYWKNKTR